MSKMNRATKILLIALVLAVAIGGFVYMNMRQVYIPEPSSDGQSFTVSSGDSNGPRLVSGFIDPYYSEVGKQQTVSIYVTDQSPITSVMVMMKTDNKDSTYNLKLVKGTNLDGYWQGSWTADDTHVSIYNAIIIASSSRGKSEINITLQ